MQGELVTGGTQRRVAAMTRILADKNPWRAPSHGKIVIDAITKSFPTADGPLNVIERLSLVVGDGEFVALIGPSGCGKTTLMNILVGFDRPDEGRVTINGKPHDGPNPDGILISQHGSVFPWLTVRQNLMFGLDGRGDKKELADHYTALVGLKGFECAYPHELSGGMLKRVEIARALVVKPEILFMDEPFSALDALMNLRVRLEMLRILQKERHTVLLITHNVEEAIHMADRVIVLYERPTKIKSIFEIPFRHPRNMSSPEAQELKRSILRELGFTDQVDSESKNAADPITRRTKAVQFDDAEV